MQGTSRNIARMVLSVTVSVAAVGLGTVTAGAWGDVSRAAHLSADPSIGSRGAVVLISGGRFTPYQVVTISFVDSNGSQPLGSAEANGHGAFTTFACIPWNASPGADTILAASPRGLAIGWTAFRVVGLTARTPGTATGKKGTARTPSLASGKGGTARTPGLASGKRGTARTPSLASGKGGTARTPSLASHKKGTATTGARAEGGADLSSVCV